MSKRYMYIGLDIQNFAAESVGRLKMRDTNVRHNIAGVESAGHQKCGTMSPEWKMREMARIRSRRCINSVYPN